MIGITKDTERLFRSDIHLNSLRWDGRTPLMDAVGAGNLETTKGLLLKVQTSMHVPTYNETALMDAAINGQANLVELLLAKGASVNTKAKERQDCPYGCGHP